MKKYLIEIIIVLTLIFIIWMLGVIYKQTKKDIGYHEVAECIEINNDIYCKIAPAVDY